MKKFILLIAAALALASCQSANKDAQMGKTNLSDCTGNWQLILFMKGGVAQTIAAADLTISEPKGNAFAVSGSLGENRFMGEFSSPSAGVIKAGNISSTRRATSQELAEFESLFSQFLNGVDSYSLKKRGGVPTLRLENSAMKAYADFTKTSIYYKLWRLEAVNDGKAVVSVNSKATLTVEKKSAAIFTGINTANLGVKVDESKNQIAFADGPMTKAAGAEEDMIVESHLMRALLSANRYSISGGTLSLYAGDTLLAEFLKQDLL